MKRLDTLPPGTIALHVRHGDKAVEMPLLPFEQYVEEAERLAGGDQALRVLGDPFAESSTTFAYPPGRFAGRVLFVSTENPEVADQAVRLATGPHAAGAAAWHVALTDENRTNAGVAAMRRQRGNGMATLESFLNLELALEADAWVCTLLSNWCQLIDELRMTVAGKAYAPYIDLKHRGHRRGDGCPAFDRNCYIQWR